MPFVDYLYNLKNSGSVSSGTVAGVESPGGFSNLAGLLPRFPERGPTAKPAVGIVRSNARGRASRGISQIQQRAEVQQQTVLAQGQPLRVAYGPCRLGADIGAIEEDGSYYVVQLIWCHGEINAITGLWFKGEEFPGTRTGATATHYTGTSTQTADPTLAGLISGYDDTCRDIINGEPVSAAYSVVRYPISLGFGAWEAEIEGLKVYDPRTDTTVYSSNPSLIRADFLSSSAYGADRTLSWASVESCADRNDSLLTDGSKRAEIGIILDNRQNVSAWAEVLRMYAEVWDYEDEGAIFMVPDAPRSVDLALTSSQIRADNMRVQTIPPEESPNVVEVSYTNTTTTPWSTQIAKAPDPDAVPTPQVYTSGGPGILPASFNAGAIQTYSQAYRFALTRLNQATLQDVRVSFEVGDHGLAIVRGDVVTLPDCGRGFDAKPFSVVDVKMSEAGYLVDAVEYQPDVYSDEVASEPTFPDTTLPLPENPPAITGLTLAVENFQTTTPGIFAQRIRATWTNPNWPFLSAYEVRVLESAMTVFFQSVFGEEYVTPALPVVSTYTVRVRAVSTLPGVFGAWAESQIFAGVKTDPPADVAELRGYEVAGIVYLSWDAATDGWEYELRHRATGGSWSTGTFIDRLRGLDKAVPGIAPGTRVFMVKAIDSAGNYSVNEASKQITITADPSRQFVDSYALTYSATDSTNIHESEMPNKNLAWFTDMDERPSINSLFSTTPLNDTNYPLPPVAYHANSDSEYVSAEVDFGGEYSGTFTLDDDCSALEGSVTVYLDLATVSGGPYTPYTDRAVSGTARYARARVKAIGADNTLACLGGTIRLDVITVPESGIATLGSGGTVTVSLAGSYTLYTSIKLQPKANGATQPGRWHYDNVNLTAGTFDIYVWDSAGSAMPSGSEVSWTIWAT